MKRIETKGVIKGAVWLVLVSVIVWLIITFLGFTGSLNSKMKSFSIYVASFFPVSIASTMIAKLIEPLSNEQYKEVCSSFGELRYNTRFIKPIFYSSSRNIKLELWELLTLYAERGGKLEALRVEKFNNGFRL